MGGGGGGAERNLQQHVLCQLHLAPGQLLELCAAPLRHLVHPAPRRQAPAKAVGGEIVQDAAGVQAQARFLPTMHTTAANGKAVAPLTFHAQSRWCCAMRWSRRASETPHTPVDPGCTVNMLDLPRQPSYTWTDVLDSILMLLLLLQPPGDDQGKQVDMRKY